MWAVQIVPGGSIRWIKVMGWVWAVQIAPGDSIWWSKAMGHTFSVFYPGWLEDGDIPMVEQR